MKNVVICLLFGIVMFMGGIFAHKSCPFVKSLVDKEQCVVKSSNCICTHCANCNNCNCCNEKCE